MTLPHGRLIALAVTLFALSTGEVRAQNTIFGITWSGQLISINTGTAAGTLIGSNAPALAFGIAFRPGGNLYAWDQTAKVIKQLDPATSNVLASINIGAMAAGEGDIAFRGDGTGFLSSSGGAPKLYTFDIVAGTSSVVGPAGASLDGLAFDAANVLYGFEQGGANLHTVNQATGATTLVGATGIPVGPPYDLGGLTFDGSGNLFGAMSTAGGASFLFSINANTGAGTLVGNIGFNGVCGLGFPTPGSPPPPPPGGGGGGGGTGGAGEGSFAGVDPPAPLSGPEGGFGLTSNHSVAAGLPIYDGVWPDPTGAVGPGQHVFNLSFKQAAQAGSQPAYSGGSAALGWAVLAALGAIAAVCLGTANPALAGTSSSSKAA